MLAAIRARNPVLGGFSLESDPQQNPLACQKDPSKNRVEKLDGLKEKSARLDANASVCRLGMLKGGMWRCSFFLLFVHKSFFILNCFSSQSGVTFDKQLRRGRHSLRRLRTCSSICP